MKEFEKAKMWRQKRKLTVDRLAELTGYGPRSIIWFEQGLSPPNAQSRKARPVQPWVWHRYRMMCAGVERQLQTKREFDW